MYQSGLPHFCHCEELAVLSEAKELISNSEGEIREARDERRLRDSFSPFPLLVSPFPIGRLLRFTRNDKIICKFKNPRYMHIRDGKLEARNGIRHHKFVLLPPASVFRPPSSVFPNFLISSAIKIFTFLLSG